MSGEPRDGVGAAAPLGHQEVWELLPWHANGTLTPEETRGVDEHLERCGLCRRELEVCRELATAVAEAGDLPLSPALRFARLAARLDGPEPSAAPARRSPAPPTVSGRGEPGGAGPATSRFAPAANAADRARSRRRSRRGPWRRTPVGVRRLVAVQTAAVALLVAGLVLTGGHAGSPASGASPGRPGAADYRTLGDPGSPPGAGADRLAVPAVRLVFREEATEAEIRRLLQASTGEIVAGPSPSGVYTVVFAPEDSPGGSSAGAGTASERLLVERLLVERLRRDPVVLFAEPVVVLPSPPVTPPS